MLLLLNLTLCTRIYEIVLPFLLYRYKYLFCEKNCLQIDSLFCFVKKKVTSIEHRLRSIKYIKQFIYQIKWISRTISAFAARYLGKLSKIKLFQSSWLGQNCSPSAPRDTYTSRSGKIILAKVSTGWKCIKNCIHTL